jgi:phospholipid-binding lipoprotein MlaA
MKSRVFFRMALLGLATSLFTNCTTMSSRKPASAASVSGPTKNDGKSVATAENDDLDEYTSESIADPLEPVNRVTFWVNDQLYTVLLRPVSKTYEKVLPKPVRTGVFNVFDNVRFPVRFVNDALQAQFPRAGQEAGCFFVNTTLGVGGIFRVSDKFPALADVPPADTGQTFAKWGIGHGFYLVLPVIGPSSARDGLGLAGDYALNPVTWVAFFYGSWAWTIPVYATDTVRLMPDKFSAYDAATENALDRYLALREAYVQYRRKAVSK